MGWEFEWYNEVGFLPVIDSCMGLCHQLFAFYKMSLLGFSSPCSISSFALHATWGYHNMGQVICISLQVDREKYLLLLKMMLFSTSDQSHISYEVAPIMFTKLQLAFSILNWFLLQRLTWVPFWNKYHVVLVWNVKVNKVKNVIQYSMKRDDCRVIVSKMIWSYFKLLEASLCIVYIKHFYNIPCSQNQLNVASLFFQTESKKS